MIGVMSAACGICGVSAAITTAPAVKARATEVAYAIGTILGLVGLGAFVDVREILKAGGRPLQIGALTGLAKWVLAGLAVLLWV